MKIFVFVQRILPCPKEDRVHGDESIRLYRQDIAKSNRYVLAHFSDDFARFSTLPIGRDISLQTRKMFSNSISILGVK